MKQSFGARPRAWASAAVFLCACSASQESSSNSDANVSFAATPFGDAASTSGAFNVTMYAAQSGLVQGLNTIEIAVTDAQGAPVDGLVLSLTPWMPAMGHGSSAIPQIVAKGSGEYVATDVALIMPGLWQLRTQLDAQEQAVVSITLP